MTSPRKRCRHCDKFDYTNEEIIRAALGTSKTIGSPTRFYPCPKQQGIFHVTSKPERLRS